MLSLSSGHLLFSLPVHAQVQESQLFKRREAVLAGFLPQPGLFLSSPLLSLGQVSICGLNTPIHAGSTFPTSFPLWPVIWEVLVMIWLQSIYALYVPAVSTIWAWWPISTESRNESHLLDVKSFVLWVSLNFLNECMKGKVLLTIKDWSDFCFQSFAASWHSLC